jgi:hypothetical protein
VLDLCFNLRAARPWALLIATLVGSTEAGGCFYNPSEVESGFAIEMQLIPHEVL